MCSQKKSIPRRSISKANTQFTRLGALFLLLMSPFFEEKTGFQGQIELTRVATVRAKYLENEIFPGQGKVGILWIAREISKGLGKSGNLKINSYGRLVQEGKGCSFS